MNNIKPPMFIPFNAKPWDESIFDTMTAWAGHGNRVSLDKLCKIFNIPQKGSEIGEEINGSKVWDFYQAGRIADIAKYCEGDVDRTRQAYKRMTFQ
jgi:predicted PolB exonuclease-like 3'-5' exonuclease